MMTPWRCTPFVTSHSAIPGFAFQARLAPNAGIKAAVTIAIDSRLRSRISRGDGVHRVRNVAVAFVIESESGDSSL